MVAPPSDLVKQIADQYPVKNGDFKVKVNDAPVSVKRSKLMTAILIAILFIVLSHPSTYKITDGIAQKVAGYNYPFVNESGPTMIGMIVHAVVFMVLVRILIR